MKLRRARAKTPKELQELARKIFDNLPTNQGRSGTKYLRNRPKGIKIASYYPPSLIEMWYSRSEDPFTYANRMLAYNGVTSYYSISSAKSDVKSSTAYYALQRNGHPDLRKLDEEWVRKRSKWYNKRLSGNSPLKSGTENWLAAHYFKKELSKIYLPKPVALRLASHDAEVSWKLYHIVECRALALLEKKITEKDIEFLRKYERPFKEIQEMGNEREKEEYYPTDSEEFPNEQELVEDDFHMPVLNNDFLPENVIKETKELKKFNFRLLFPEYANPPGGNSNIDYSKFRRELKEDDPLILIHIQGICKFCRLTKIVSNNTELLYLYNFLSLATYENNDIVPIIKRLYDNYIATLSNASSSTINNNNNNNNNKENILKGYDEIIDFVKTLPYYRTIGKDIDYKVLTNKDPADQIEIYTDPNKQKELIENNNNQQSIDQSKPIYNAVHYETLPTATDYMRREFTEGIAKVSDRVHWAVNKLNYLKNRDELDDTRRMQIKIEGYDNVNKQMKEKMKNYMNYEEPKEYFTVEVKDNDNDNSNENIMSENKSNKDGNEIDEIIPDIAKTATASSNNGNKKNKGGEVGVIGEEEDDNLATGGIGEGGEEDIEATGGKDSNNKLVMDGNEDNVSEVIDSEDPTDDARNNNNNNNNRYLDGQAALLEERAKSKELLINKREEIIKRLNELRQKVYDDNCYEILTKDDWEDDNDKENSNIMKEVKEIKKSQPAILKALIDSNPLDYNINMTPEECKRSIENDFKEIEKIVKEISSNQDDYSKIKEIPLTKAQKLLALSFVDFLENGKYITKEQAKELYNIHRLDNAEIPTELRLTKDSIYFTQKDPEHPIQESETTDYMQYVPRRILKKKLYWSLKEEELENTFNGRGPPLMHDAPRLEAESNLSRTLERRLTGLDKEDMLYNNGGKYIYHQHGIYDAFDGNNNGSCSPVYNDTIINDLVHPDPLGINKTISEGMDKENDQYYSNLNQALNTLTKIFDEHPDIKKMFLDSNNGNGNGGSPSDLLSFMNFEHPEKTEETMNQLVECLEIITKSGESIDNNNENKDKQSSLPSISTTSTSLTPELKEELIKQNKIVKSTIDEYNKQGSDENHPIKKVDEMFNDIKPQSSFLTPEELQKLQSQETDTTRIVDRLNSFMKMINRIGNFPIDQLSYPQKLILRRFGMLHYSESLPPIPKNWQGVGSALQAAEQRYKDYDNGEPRRGRFPRYIMSSFHGTKSQEGRLLAIRYASGGTMRNYHTPLHERLLTPMLTWEDYIFNRNEHGKESPFSLYPQYGNIKDEKYEDIDDPKYMEKFRRIQYYDTIKADNEPNPGMEVLKSKIVHNVERRVRKETLKDIKEMYENGGEDNDDEVDGYNNGRNNNNRNNRYKDEYDEDDEYNRNIDKEDEESSMIEVESTDYEMKENLSPFSEKEDISNSELGLESTSMLKAEIFGEEEGNGKGGSGKGHSKSQLKNKLIDDKEEDIIARNSRTKGFPKIIAENEALTLSSKLVFNPSNAIELINKHKQQYNLSNGVNNDEVKLGSIDKSNKDLSKQLYGNNVNEHELENNPVWKEIEKYQNHPETFKVDEIKNNTNTDQLLDQMLFSKGKLILNSNFNQQLIDEIQQTDGDIKMLREYGKEMKKINKQMDYDKPQKSVVDLEPTILSMKEETNYNKTHERHDKNIVDAKKGKEDDGAATPAASGAKATDAAGKGKEEKKKDDKATAGGAASADSGKKGKKDKKNKGGKDAAKQQQQQQQATNQKGGNNNKNNKKDSGKSNNNKDDNNNKGKVPSLREIRRTWKKGDPIPEQFRYSESEIEDYYQPTDNDGMPYENWSNFNIRLMQKELKEEKQKQKKELGEMDEIDLQQTDEESVGDMILFHLYDSYGVDLSKFTQSELEYIMKRMSKLRKQALIQQMIINPHYKEEYEDIPGFMGSVRTKMTNWPGPHTGFMLSGEYHPHTSVVSISTYPIDEKILKMIGNRFLPGHDNKLQENATKYDLELELKRQALQIPKHISILDQLERIYIKEKNELWHNRHLRYINHYGSVFGNKENRELYKVNGVEMIPPLEYKLVKDKDGKIVKQYPHFISDIHKRSIEISKNNNNQIKEEGKEKEVKEIENNNNEDNDSNSMSMHKHQSDTKYLPKNALSSSDDEIITSDAEIKEKTELSNIPPAQIHSKNNNNNENESNNNNNNNKINERIDDETLSQIKQTFKEYITSIDKVNHIHINYEEFNIPKSLIYDKKWGLDQKELFHYIQGLNDENIVPSGCELYMKELNVIKELQIKYLGTYSEYVKYCNKDDLLKHDIKKEMPSFTEILNRNTESMKMVLDGGFSEYKNIYDKPILPNDKINWK